MSDALYRPPAPVPMTPLRSLLRVMREGDGNLLSLVPKAAYRERITPLGYSRRSIVLINDPQCIRDVMTDPLEIFPKNDLFVGALEPLVGDSIFVSSGKTWRRQRRMIDPAFSHMRINQAFPAMADAVAEYEKTLDRHSASGELLSLDVAMSQLTADVICRTIFSQSLESNRAKAVFKDFMAFERAVASVEIRRLIFGKAFEHVPQPDHVLAACERIRGHIDEMLAPRFARDAQPIDDIVGAVMAARDPDTGKGFTRQELIDQIGVFFLAGHETTASVLTWTFFILSQQPETVARLRREVEEVVGDGPLRFEHVKKLALVRSVFREALRLYPPITFIPRVATESTRIAGRRIKRGAMVMISPWTTHRNALLWDHADRFDPDRFLSGNEQSEKENTFLSFGLGPRVCIGAAFATIESGLILASLVRRYDFEPEHPGQVRPVARLTTRPAKEIMCRVRRRE
ncbi:MAG: cytochrome P450 [Pseudomonadota bacterium]